jgi:hypothetical protein
MPHPTPPLPLVATTTGLKTASRVRWHAFVWTGPTTAADDLRIEDAAGNLLWLAKTDTTSTYLGISFGQDGLESEGLQVDTIDAGTFIAYRHQDVGGPL